MKHKNTPLHWGKSPLSMLVFCCFALSMPAHSESYLVKDGKALSEIVISERPARMAKLAAEELHAYVKKITGAELSIAAEPSEGVPVQVYVGRSAHTDRLKITDEGLEHGAFRMVSGDDWLVLLGRDRDFTPPKPHLKNNGDWPRLTQEWDQATGEKWGYPHSQVYKGYSGELGIWDVDERGSMNAVCELLRMQGVRWYLPHELGEIVPKNPTIELPKVDKTVRPDFAFRHPYQYFRRFAHSNLGATRDEMLWQLRLGFSQAPDLFGFGAIAHGMNQVHRRDEVKEAHPEYYALFSGKRDTDKRGAGRPCLSSEGLLQANVRYARAVYDILGVPMVSVMPQDGYASLCQCELCRGKGTPKRGWNGQMSDYVWDYVNRVSQELYKTHPDKKVSCLAYGTYLLPPTKIDKLSPNLAVGIAQARRDFHDPKKREWIAEIRKGWLDKMPGEDRQLWLYEYYLHTNPGNTYGYMPVFFPHTIARDLRSLKGICMGEFIDMYRQQGVLGGLAVDHLNLYVTARFWWDADQDVEAMLEEYYTLFYGPVRDEMKAFIEYSEANWMDLRKSPEKISEVFGLLAVAQQKVPANSVYAKRIALIADYLVPLKQIQEHLAKGRENVPEAHAIARRNPKIKIDGKPAEKAWQELAAHSLRELQTGKESASKTSFRLFWSDDALYISVRCEEADAEAQNVATTEDGDMNIWNGDCVEILLETDSHSYYQLTINPAGALVDLDRKKGIDNLWSSQAEVAAHVGERYWNVEARIPVAGPLQEELDVLNGVAGRTPIKARPWFFNVCRQRVRDDGTELSAFSPTKKKHFHDTMKFGKLYVK